MQQVIIPSSPKLALTVAGQGPLVIFVHGLGGDRSTWLEQLRALEADYTAASVDLRGYGDSEDPAGEVDFKKDFCQDLLAVMDHFKVPRAHLVGLSMGGRVCRSTALQAPERVASLTLANTSPGFDHLTPDQLEKFVKDRAGSLQDTKLPKEFGKQQAMAMMAPEASTQAIEAMAKAVNRLRVHNYLNILRASTLQDRGDRLEDIACPVHLITSDRDTVYPPHVAEHMRDRIPHATLSTIADAGHISNLEQPEAFNSALKQFLDTLPAEAFAHKA